MDLKTTPRWHKSTHSDTGSCVEVADNLSGRVLVRDSKDQAGPMLTFAPGAWSAFVATVTARHP